MKIKEIEIKKDLVIAGAGIPGICTAVMAARMGLKVALINNRGFLGGNGSAEIGICISGATGTQEFNYYARESGFIEELLLDNLHKNQHGNRYIWDNVIMDIILAEPNIEVFLHTNIDEVETEENKIKYITGAQSTTETRFVFHAPLFVDDTGDGTVGYLAGAEYRYGREGQEEFGEKIAPPQPDNHVLPSNISFLAKDIGEPVSFIRPHFALDLSKTDVLKYRSIPKNEFARSHWFYEIDGKLDQMAEAETTIMNHKKLVYGIWDEVKNSGNYPAENYDIEYLAPVPGKRESRRLMGDYILTESDVIGQKDFEDGVGYGGWSIDLHAIDGFYATEPINKHIFLKGIYQIPYRCGYSKNIDNLFIEGRCMSTSHVAFGSTRVIATLSTIGQANAVAAFLCKKYQTTPRGVYETHLAEMKTILMEQDQHMIGCEYTDPKNLASDCDIIVSSSKIPEITNMHTSKPLEYDLAWSLPIDSHLENFFALLKSSADTSIAFEVYKPSKKENYGPHTLLTCGEVKISASDDFQWVKFPVALSDVHGFYFVVLKANSLVEYGFSKDTLTGVMTTYAQPVDADVIIDVDTLGKKKQMWRKTFYEPRIIGTACFKTSPSEDVFGVQNLKNGFTRPYQMPNIWHASGVSGESIHLKFKEAKQVEEVVMFFDTDLDFYLCNNQKMPYPQCPLCVKDYDISFKNQKGEFEILCEIRGNYQRVSKTRFPQILTDEIKINFLATNGSAFVSVYSVRIY